MKKKDKVKFSMWFDPYNPKHIEAWKSLEENGYWPEDFIPDNVVMGKDWALIGLLKIASAWIDHILEGPRHTNFTF